MSPLAREANVWICRILYKIGKKPILSKSKNTASYWHEANVFNDNIRSQPLIGGKPMSIQKAKKYKDWQRANILHKYEKSIIGQSQFSATRCPPFGERPFNKQSFIDRKPMFAEERSHQLAVSQCLFVYVVRSAAADILL